VLWDDDEEDDADDDDGADQSADEELLQCDLSLDFGMGDREKFAAAATALEVAEEHALPVSSNPRSHSPSWQPHSPFQPSCLSQLGVSFRFLQFRNSFLFSSVFSIFQSSLSVFFLPRLKISPILCGLYSQILIIRTGLRA
jgi:hypothetical protein